MENRKVINDRIVQWIRNKVETEYPDDVSLALIYGSHINGTANSRSDVDCYYIPKTERAYALGMDFIIDGVGYDLFPISWERAARIADLQEDLTPLIGDVQIVYCCSPEDMARFRALQDRLRANLLSDDYVSAIAAQRCEHAGRMCALMHASRRASDIRKLAGQMIMTLADAVAVHSHDYYHYGLKRQFDDLQSRFPGLPRDIIDDYRHVVQASDAHEAMTAATKMLHDVCGFLHITLSPQTVSAPEAPEPNGVDAPLLAGLYEEISSTFNKIYVCCESGNAVLAFLSAVCLQRELDDARTAGSPVYDLLSGFHHQRLEALSALIRTVEDDFVRFIKENGGHIKTFDSFEAFLQASL